MTAEFRNGASLNSSIPSGRYSNGRDNIMANDRLLRIGEVIERTGLARVTIHRLRKKGEFPEPLRAGGRAVRWRESEIQGWMDSLSRANKPAAAA